MGRKVRRFRKGDKLIIARKPTQDQPFYDELKHVTIGAEITVDGECYWKAYGSEPREYPCYYTPKEESYKTFDYIVPDVLCEYNLKYQTKIASVL